MSLTSANRTVQLLKRLTDTKSATEPIIKTDAQKPCILSEHRSARLARTLPERQGLSSRHISGFLKTLAEDPTLRMHSIMIVRNGSVVCEAAFGAQDITIPRATFSACKSIVALAVGILMDDGLLHAEDRLVDLFPQHGTLVSRRLMKDLTVKQLLQMQTGNQFSEAASMTQTDWLQGFFASAPLTSSQKFHYNSLNTYVLSRIVCQISGQPLSQFLAERLFEPMGIRDFYWEVCPEGFEKGGWGLYLRAEDLAKLGQLIIDDGKWNGTQLISSEFLACASKAQVSTPASCGNYDYGWHFWVHREKNIVLFNGMLGQNVMCFRDSGIVVVSHAGNEEVFQQSSYFSHAEHFFDGTAQDAAALDLPGVMTLKRTKKRLLCTNIHPAGSALFDRFQGRTFEPNCSHAPSTGLMPKAMQVIYNCYTQGLKSISISGTRRHPHIAYEEHGCIHHIDAGVKAPNIQELEFDGNRFRVAAKAAFVRNEDGYPVLRLSLDFWETPFSRVLKLILAPTGVVLQQPETPCMDQIIQTALSFAPAAAKTVITTLWGNGEQDFLHWKLSCVFSPTLNMKET